MTNNTGDKQNMTCGQWFALGIFAVLGIFAFMMFNLVSDVQENRQERVQEFFDNLANESYLDAYKMLADEWQLALENTNGLVREFDGIHVTNTTFGLEMGACWTATIVVNGERRSGADSQQYMFADGTADMNGDTVEVSVTMTFENSGMKIVGLYLDDVHYGMDSPEDCIFTD